MSKMTPEGVLGDSWCHAYDIAVSFSVILRTYMYISVIPCDHRNISFTAPEVFTKVAINHHLNA